MSKETANDITSPRIPIRPEDNSKQRSRQKGSRALCTGAATMARLNGCKSRAVVNSDTPDNKLRIPPEEHALQDGGQLGSTSDPASCSICTDNFAENENVRILPCGHFYHRHCIDPCHGSWIAVARVHCGTSSSAGIDLKSAVNNE